jgi:hypothetical protein
MYSTVRSSTGFLFFDIDARMPSVPVLAATVHTVVFKSGRTIPHITMVSVSRSLPTVVADNFPPNGIWNLQSLDGRYQLAVHPATPKPVVSSAFIGLLYHFNADSPVLSWLCRFLVGPNYISLLR